MDKVAENGNIARAAVERKLEQLREQAQRQQMLLRQAEADLNATLGAIQILEHLLALDTEDVPSDD